jgi:hypothetical protein
MFIDPLRSGSALRQEGHVDFAKPLLPRPRSNHLMLNHLYFGSTWPSWRRARSATLVAAINMSLLTEG